MHSRGTHCWTCSDFFGVSLGLLRDEDAVEELTLVLAADAAYLLDLGAHQREGSVVNSIEDDLTLDIGGELAGGATLHLDELVLLTTKEVLDSDLRAVLGDSNVDGEMSVNKSHLVAEALKKTNNESNILFTSTNRSIINN